MFRIAFRSALAVLLALGLVGALTAEAGYPLTLKDATGYSLVLAAKPKAIASLTQTSTEVLFSLVDPARLAAIDTISPDPGISNVSTQAKAFPVKVAGEKEKVLALGSDLVLVASWKEPEFIQALRDAKVPVFVFKTPDNFDDLRVLVAQLAQLVGEPAKGQALLADVDRRLAAVAAKVKGVSADKRVSVLSWSTYGGTYAKGTSFDALTEKAGLVNVATRAGMSGWPNLSKEQVLALDPDLVALPSWSFDGTLDPQKFAAAFASDPAFAGLKAVKTKRVVVMQDKHLQATSQYMVDGVEDLARAAYPELFR